MGQINGSCCYVDLMRKRVRGGEEEEENGDQEAVMISPSSGLPPTYGNGTMSSKFYHGGKSRNNGLSLSVSAPSTPAIPGWYADMHPLCPGKNQNIHRCSSSVLQDSYTRA